MKKLIAIVLAVMLAVSCTIAVSAENATPGTTTLTTTVPDAEYTLNIPGDLIIDYGTTRIELNLPTITNASGFAESKNLQVDFTYTKFSCPDTETTIPISLRYTTLSNTYDFTQNSLIYEGNSSGGLDYSPITLGRNDNGSLGLTDSLVNKMLVLINNTAWGRALAGNYTATITFNAEVVSGFKVRE